MSARTPLRSSVVIPTERQPRYRRRARLMSLADYRAELNRMYRAARAGQIRPEDASRFAFVLRTGHEMLRLQEELAQLRALERQLAAIQANSGTAGLALDASTHWLPALSKERTS